MILIDPSKEEQELILTLDGVADFSDLSLVHDATRKAFSLVLGADISPSLRYSLFTVPTVEFDGMPEGYYSYSIFDASTGFKIESGKLLIKPTASEAIPAVNDTSTDYLVNE